MINSPQVRDHAEILRDEMFFKDRIVSLLRDKPRTIPEIAESLGCPGHEVVLWVMAMRRYGAVVETGEANDDGYFQYTLKENAR